MQPLAHSPISPVFYRPTVLPQARPEGEVCGSTGGSKRKGSVEWKTFLKTKKKLKLRFASSQNQITMPEMQSTVSSTYRQFAALSRPRQTPGIWALAAEWKGKVKPGEGSFLKGSPPGSLPDGSNVHTSGWVYRKSESEFPAFLTNVNCFLLHHN